MPVSVDTVYQRVLALTNKEQRGYVTPQEFNLLANQAQLKIFESYFYLKNQRQRIEPDLNVEPDETDLAELLDRKLAPFMSTETVIGGHTYPTNITVDMTSYPVYQTGRVYLNDELCQRVSVGEARRFLRSTRHMLTTANQAPIYTDNRTSGRDILVYAGSNTESTANVYVECFRKPTIVEWAYVVVNGQALYNANLAQDFELHASEEDTLVHSIMEYAGVITNKHGLFTIARSNSAQELQNQST